MLKSMLGSSNYSTLDVKEIGDRFSTAMLFGKTANLGDDISDSYYADSSQLKKIVTGNTLKAERKGQDPFDFTPYCTMLFSANVMPRINDPTGAMQRRLLIIPMKASFKKSDPDYDPAITYKLQQKDCIEYFIQLAITGLSEVLNNKAFTEPKKVQDELDIYAKENNPLLAFIGECDIEQDIINEPTNEVFKRFEVFCSENGFKPMSKTTFSKRVNIALGTRCKDKRLPGGRKGIVFEWDSECSG
jgi:putative DNA primase/helicase